MSHAVGVYLIAQSGSRSNLGAAPQFAFPLYTLFLLRGNGAKERAKVKAGKYADLSKMRDLKEEKQKPRNRTRSSASSELTVRLIGQFPAENGHRYIIRRAQAPHYLLLPVV